MNRVIHTALVVAALLIVGSAQADDQPPLPDGQPDAKTKPTVAVSPRPGEPGVYRMEIYNGARRTVHYVPIGLSPSEVQAVLELERAENQTSSSTGDGRDDAVAKGKDGGTGQPRAKASPTRPTRKPAGSPP
jgi:hypothetical protein